MIELVIEERRRSIGAFEVGRVLPFAKRRMVGPFIFLDHMGRWNCQGESPAIPTCGRIHTSGSPRLRISLQERD
jgi:redox-sensitive bicupin YhaK (pirin superfamily)